MQASEVVVHLNIFQSHKTVEQQHGLGLTLDGAPDLSVQ